MLHAELPDTPQIETRPVLDLKVYAWRQRHGDLEVFGTWYRDPTGGAAEHHRQALVLIRASRRRGEQQYPCIIPLNSAHKYAEFNPAEGRFIVEQAVKFMQMPRSGIEHVLAAAARSDALFSVLLDTAYTVATFVKLLGMSENASSVRRLLSIVRDHLGDLLTLPPRPPVDPYVAADIIVQGSDGSEHTAEVTDDV